MFHGLRGEKDSLLVKAPYSRPVVPPSARSPVIGHLRNRFDPTCSGVRTPPGLLQHFGSTVFAFSNVNWLGLSLPRYKRGGRCRDVLLPLPAYRLLSLELGHGV